MRRIYTILLFLFSSFSLLAQNNAGILSPLPGDTVVSGQLLIVYRFPDSVQIVPASVQLTIDLTKRTKLLKTNGNKISLLELEPLTPGYKIVRIEAKSKKGKQLRAEWGFYVRGKTVTEINGKKTPKPVIRFDVETKSKFADVTGPGAELLQEPPSTQVLRLTGSVKTQKTEIPVKIHLTNFEDPSLQARNRFMVGFKTKRAGVILGDVYPQFQHLVLNNTRVRGASAYLRLNWLQMDAVYGTLRRSIEGVLRYYNSLENPEYAPVNLQVIPNQNDSVIMIQGYYTDSGTYRRNYIAGRLSLGSEKRNAWFRITMARATDDTTSINYGGAAAQNIVLGMAFDFMTKNRKFKLDMGLSSSMTTKDIRNGVATKEDFYNFYRMHLVFDPYDFRKLIVINTTTNLETEHTPFLTWYVKSFLKTKNQHISVEARRIGSDYHSFGDPFLINDRLGAIFADRMRFLKNRLFVNLYYRYYKDNLTGICPATRYNNIVNASFSFKPADKLPGIVGGVNMYLRNYVNKNNPETNYKNNVRNVNLGLSYNFRILKSSTMTMVNYSNNFRKDRQSGQNILNHLLNVSFMQDYTFGLNVALQYNFLLLTSGNTEYSKNNTYYFKIGYNTPNRKFGFFFNARRIYFMQTLFFPESLRSSFYLEFKYSPFSNFDISLEAGKSDYSEKQASGRNYNELWGMVSLHYNFSSASKAFRSK